MLEIDLPRKYTYIMKSGNVYISRRKRKEYVKLEKFLTKKGREAKAVVNVDNNKIFVSYYNCLGLPLFKYYSFDFMEPLIVILRVLKWKDYKNTHAYLNTDNKSYIDDLNYYKKIYFKGYL